MIKKEKGDKTYTSLQTARSENEKPFETLNKLTKAKWVSLNHYNTLNMIISIPTSSRKILRVQKEVLKKITSTSRMTLITAHNW